MELLSWKPRAYLYHHFLSDEECDHIIKASGLTGGVGGTGAWVAQGEATQMRFCFKPCSLPTCRQAA